MAERTEEIKLALHPLAIDDLPLIMAWRNDAEIMRYLSSAPKRLTWGEQLTWWRTTPLDRMDFLASVVERDGFGWNTFRPVGTSHVKGDGEVGILIGEKGLWGHGVGRQALALTLKGCRYRQGIVAPHLPFWAVIHPENVASQHVFAANGFVKTAEPGRNGQEVWRLKA